MRLYASGLKLLNQSILILTAPSVRRPGLELDPWRKKCQQKPSRTGPDIRRRPTQSYEVAAQLKSVSPRVWSGYSRIRFSDINLTKPESRDGTGRTMAREREWIYERSRFMFELARGGKVPPLRVCKTPPTVKSDLCFHDTHSF